ncbi:MAG: hypothetical protein EOM83_02020 [Clostridia bacterium]|nr:hypothetical protein [Clostridia bacterium]
MKNLNILLILILSLMVSATLKGQDSPLPVQFHGSNIFIGQYSNMQGIGQEIPPSFYHNELQMTLTAYDIPVSASFFVTSQQSDMKQSINNFRIYFDYRKMLQNKGLNLSDDIVTAAAMSGLNKIESTKAELEKSEDLIKTDITGFLGEVDVQQKIYIKAQKELEEAQQRGDVEGVEKAKMRMAEAKAAREKAISAYENAKLKMEELQAKLKTTLEAVEKAKGLVEKAKSQTYDSKAIRKNAEAKARETMLPGVSRLMSNFTTFEIGRCRPNYSELTLRGVPVSGVNIEFTPGKFYSAFTTGKTKRPITPDSITRPVYEQNILFGKFGYGKKQSTHFYLSYLHAEDDINSLPSPPESDTTLVGARSNYVIGSELKLSFFKRKFIIEGEGAMSMLTRDTQAPEIDWSTTDVPDWASGLFEPNMSSSVDYAYNLKADLKLNKTNISGGVQMTGPGFVTLGNPYLVNDRLTYHGSIKQTFAKRQVSITAFYKQHTDNLIEWKKNTSQTHAYGITTGFRFRKAPYLMVSYMPILQETANDTLDLTNQITLINITSGYNYKIGNCRSMTSFSFFYQDAKTGMDSIVDPVKNSTYTLTEILNFTKPVSISTTISYTQCAFLGQEIERLMLSLSGSLMAFKNKWSNTLGVNFSHQDVQHQKIGFFCDSSLQLWKGSDLGLRAEKNIIDDVFYSDVRVDEFIAKLSIRFSW